MDKLWHAKYFTTNYGQGIERLTAVPAGPLISQSGILNNAQRPMRIFDNACGKGIVTALLNRSGMEMEKVELLAGDLSPLMVNATKELVEKEGWKNVETKVVDGQDTKLPENEFDYVLVNFGIMLFPDPMKGLKECLRVAKPGAVMSYTTWSQMAFINLANEVIVRLGADKVPQKDIRFLIWAKTGNWHEAAFVKEQTLAAGFVDVETRPYEFEQEYESPKAFVENFRFLLGGAIGFVEESKRVETANMMATDMLALLEERYGKGSFKLTFEALVTTGKKQSLSK